jgi:2-amino-4-hydroxy-6-hydroxymethyldihydropteridine diphosphokinase
VLDQPPFLNAACRARTTLAPPAVLDLAKATEAALGRTAGRRYGPRAIDCDLLLWEGGSWADERLQVPHPRLAERRFALLPLLDLDPDLALPDGRRLADLAAALDPADQPARRLRRMLPAHEYNDRPAPPRRPAP